MNHKRDHLMKEHFLSNEIKFRELKLKKLTEISILNHNVLVIISH